MFLCWKVDGWLEGCSMTRNKLRKWDCFICVLVPKYPRKCRSQSSKWTWRAQVISFFCTVPSLLGCLWIWSLVFIFNYFKKIFKIIFWLCCSQNLSFLTRDWTHPNLPQQWKFEVFYPLDHQESLHMIFILSSAGPYSTSRWWSLISSLEFNFLDVRQQMNGQRNCGTCPQ